MNQLSRFQAPVITDEDVSWVCDVLNLPATAFRGPDGKDPRLEILKSTATVDIEACPGSGKTTLLVAKLAILSRKWMDWRRGLCVLSHTNAARREIEKRLGNNAVGQRLLSYPHFVGTIHGFVNEFLSIPWLRSLGYPTRVIENDLCEQHRRRLLQFPQFRALATYVASREANGKLNVVSKWRVASPKFDVLKESGKPEFTAGTKPSAKQLCALVGKCASDGYHRYDEMFMWAHDLLASVPELRDALRQRFPMLFIDEVQDNSEEQSALLYRVFIGGENPVIRQRFGDANQAIYQYAAQTDGAKTDPFPCSSIRKDIPNSYRFGQEIANLANPLAPEPQRLVGCGPPNDRITAACSGQHAIFLFAEDMIRSVLGTYARYLQELFSPDELQEGMFVAVGSVHRPGEENNLPRFVGQYWRDYDHELTALEPKPKTFLQYIIAGRSSAEHSNEAHFAVEMAADAILRLARLANPTVELGNRRRKHRQILELLAEKSESNTNYVDFIKFVAIERKEIMRDAWNNKWSGIVKSIAAVISGRRTDSDNGKAFLDWPPSENGKLGATKPRQGDNIFRYPVDDPMVEVHLGSIHSVKGQTHTATLVLDTYYKKHHLATLKPWLLGQKIGRENEGKENQSRLKQLYVAMTRPTHLLCLAMRDNAFEAEEISQLKKLSWRIARVRDGTPEWL